MRVYGVSLSSDAETRLYVDGHGLTFPVLRFPEEKLRQLYRANGVPQVIVLDHEGQVIHTRPGELGEGAALDSLFAAAVRISDTDGRTEASESSLKESTSR